MDLLWEDGLLFESGAYQGICSNIFLIFFVFFFFLLFHVIFKQHERFLHDAKVCPCDVLFIGDSIIRNMYETEV